MTAQEEYEEIIQNAEEACRKGEITKEELWHIRNVVAKAIVIVEVA